VFHPCVWRNGLITQIGTDFGSANAVNESGQVIGTFGDYHNPTGFVWDNGQLTTLGQGTTPVAINNRGQIVGSEFDGSGFLWERGQTLNLPSGGTAISDTGVVLAGGTQVWDGGVLTTLPSLGGAYTQAFAMNANATMIGGQAQTISGEYDAVIWTRS
jgi:probable HAF family extracellular repeat protein